jgi:hypothetical protein
MNIWRIGCDYEYPSLMIPDKYTNLASPEDDQSDTIFYDLEGLPLIDIWTPLDFCVDNNPTYLKGRANFMKAEEFACNNLTLDAFGDELLEDIELLPIFVDSEEFYTLHVLRFVDCLDKERSEIVYDELDDVENVEPTRNAVDYTDYMDYYPDEDEDEDIELEDMPQPVFITLDGNTEDNNPFNVSHIKKFVMNAEKTPDCMLFRVPERFVYLFATDKFRDIYIASGFTGLTFKPVEVI